MLKKNNFLHIATPHRLPDTYPLFLENRQFSPFSTVNIFYLPSTRDLNCKFLISFIIKSASSRLDVLYRLYQLFSPCQMQTVVRSPYGSCVICVGECSHFLPFRKEWSFKAFRFISSPSFIDCLLPLNLSALLPLSSRIDVFMLTAFSNLLTACFPPPPSRSLTAHFYLCTYSCSSLFY